MHSSAAGLTTTSSIFVTIAMLMISCVLNRALHDFEERIAAAHHAPASIAPVPDADAVVESQETPSVMTSGIFQQYTAAVCMHFAGLCHVRMWLIGCNWEAQSQLSICAMYVIM